MARAMDLQVPDGHPMTSALATLDRCASSTILPSDADQPFGTSWTSLLVQEDRAAALDCYRAAALMALKRGLRNGSIGVSFRCLARARLGTLYIQKHTSPTRPVYTRPRF